VFSDSFSPFTAPLIPTNPSQCCAVASLSPPPASKFEILFLSPRPRFEIPNSVSFSKTTVFLTGEKKESESEGIIRPKARRRTLARCALPSQQPHAFAGGHRTRRLLSQDRSSSNLFFSRGRGGPGRRPHHHRHADEQHPHRSPIPDPAAMPQCQAPPDADRARVPYGH